MPNPFPGIDPYVESQLTWRSFHTAFLTHLHDEIAARIPERYDVDIEGEVSLVAHPPGEGRSWRYPDLQVTVDPLRTSPRPSPTVGRTALAIEPVTVPLATEAVEVQAVHRWIEVRRQPGRSLVAVVELLSPSNKAEPGSPRLCQEATGIDRPAGPPGRDRLSHRGPSPADGRAFAEGGLLRIRLERPDAPDRTATSTPGRSVSRSPRSLSRSTRPTPTYPSIWPRRMRRPMRTATTIATGPPRLPARPAPGPRRPRLGRGDGPPG